MWRVYSACENPECANTELILIIEAVNQESAYKVAQDHALNSPQLCPLCGESLLFFPEENS
jgi:hypothetical protein